MKRLVKILIVLAVIVVIGVACFGFVRQCVNQMIVGNAVASLTGSEEAGQAITDILNGKDLTDAELAEAFGLDAATFAQIKQAAADAGIDLNDSEQLSGIITANTDKLGQLKDLFSQASSGDMSANELAAELKDTLTIPEAS